ncbi:hypothetical protein [Roseivirga sp.]|uniref:hypothetical protein n=1 Tax=Roseivirga sp. TaxID=1964215 RepID=UPI003B52DCB3
MKKWQIQIQSAANDLTHLEINTIIASDMTAAKTPSRSRELLHGIAIKYDKKLTDLLIEYKLIEYLKENKRYNQQVANQLNGLVRQSGFLSFEEFQTRARLTSSLISEIQGSIDKPADDIDADLGMLNRIDRNAESIKDVLFQADTRIQLNNGALTGKRTVTVEQRSKTNWFKKEAKIKEVTVSVTIDDQEKKDQLIELLSVKNDKGEPKNRATFGDTPDAIFISREGQTTQRHDISELDLDIRQFSILKKAYDIGTSRVALQTIIGLDGDVTTRIAKSFADNQIPLVNELHHDGIRLSVNYWEKLIDALTKFGEYIVGKLTK